MTKSFAQVAAEMAAARAAAQDRWLAERAALRAAAQAEATKALDTRSESC